MRSLAQCLLICLLSCRCLGQGAVMSIFTTEHGLPSNVVYQTLEDDLGFLWVATDQGVARFDGKEFSIFAKDQGVPDTEVLQLAKEKNGRIWIRCYNSGIAYFDPVRNRFIDVTPIANLLHINGIKKILSILEGGMRFDNEEGSWLLQQKDNHTYSLRPPVDSTYLLAVSNDGSEFRYGYNEKNKIDSAVYVYHVKGNTILEKRSLGFLGKDLVFDIDEDRLLIFIRNSTDFFVADHFSNTLETVRIQKNQLLHQYYIHNRTDKFINILSRSKDSTSGKDIIAVNTYDKKSIQYLFTLSGDFIAFHMLNDAKENLWVSTVHSGLFVYRKASLVTQNMKPPYNNVNFYSLMKTDDGTLYAGNERGEIVTIGANGTQDIHTVFTTGKIEWQRNIIRSQNKIFTFSDGGIFVNYIRELKPVSADEHQESKVVLELNDSIVISGSNTGLCMLNTISEKLRPLYSSLKVVTGLASINNRQLYVGSTDGLHRFDLDDLALHDKGLSDPFLKERVVGLCSTPDSLIWIATATNGVLVMKNEKIIAHIRESDGLASTNSLTIAKGRNGDVWIGTNAGVSKISYVWENNKLTTSIRNVSVIDGLASPITNQLVYDRGNLYAATEKGVCMIPDSILVPSIKVSLVNVQINQRDATISNTYSLNADQKSVRLKFAGVDLRGYFKHVDYSKDQGATWIQLEGSDLPFEFDNGEHSIWVRAVDVNKNIGKDILKLRFDIATPYWKTWWFWTLIALLIQIAVGYIFYRRHQQKELEKKRIELAKAHLASLEQQAFVSLMNPHFMFNALNSIQHYINNQDRQNANRYLSDFASLIRKNFEAAQQAFIPLEQEIENISLYIRLERMRFNDKFSFEMEYEDDLDPEDWMMPTMILQPLIENSILHGIMPSGIPGQLVLQLSLRGNDLLIEVIDNGIGVENSRAMKQGSKHRSRGMELIYKRLTALSFFSSQKLELHYSVPFEDTSNPGNKISLLIPGDLYQAWRKAQKNME